MKKFFISLLLFSSVLMISTSFGQGIKVGPKVGFNASQLHTSFDSLSSQFKSGFQVGAFVRLGGKVYLQPEIYYSSQGGIFKSNFNNWQQKINLGTLDIPVLVGISFLDNDLFDIHLTAGPMASFVINKDISNSGDINASKNTEIKSADIKNANWYIQAGAGVDIWKFTIDVRYQIGLNKIINNVAVQGRNVNLNTSNNVWVVSLGFNLF